MPVPSCNLTLSIKLRDTLGAIVILFEVDDLPNSLVFLSKTIGKLLFVDDPETNTLFIAPKPNSPVVLPTPLTSPKGVIPAAGLCVDKLSGKAKV